MKLNKKKFRKPKFKTINDYYLYRDKEANYIETKNIKDAERLINSFSYLWHKEFKQESDNITIISKKLYKTQNLWIIVIESGNTYIEINHLDFLKESFNN